MKNESRKIVKSNLVSSLALLVLLLASTSCKVGGMVTNDGLPYSLDPITPIVLSPTLATPAISPYYSSASSLLITGMCMVGDQVEITGDLVGTTTCQGNSSFSFTANRNADGVYVFQITQYDPSGNASLPVPFIWIRKSTITPPSILTPSVQPYKSAKNSVTISGACETGSTITLSGDGAGSTTCVASAYSLTLPKNADGDYTLHLTASDPAGNSAGVNLIWNKHALQASPSAPTLMVNSPQVLDLSGGSEGYSVSITTNLSGSTYTPGTRTYRSGTLAGVTDTLTVTDSYGDQVTIPIQTVAGVPDHLELIDGDNQTGTIGSILTINLSAKLVDRYGNGIANYPLIFTRKHGDAVLLDSEIQITDANGASSMEVRLGHTGLKNRIRVAPLTGTLPDLALSGNPTLTFTAIATTSGKSLLGLQFNTGNAPSSLIKGSFITSGQGDLMVVNASDNTIGLYQGLGQGLFGSMRTFNLGACMGADQIVSGDFNGDSKLDVAVTCLYSSSIAIRLGRGDSSFENTTILSTADSPGGITAADVNGDGKTDLIVTSTSGNTITVHLGNGNGSFQSGVDYSTGSAPVGITTSDLNRDGKPDLIVANSGTSKIGVHLNSGSGTFPTYSEFYGGSMGLNHITSADLDRDGNPDILVTNGPDNSCTIFYGDGTGGFDTPVSLSTGTVPNSILALDLDQDGKMDLVVSNLDDSTLSIFYGSGSRTFASAQTLPTAGGPLSLLAFEANGDSHTDVFLISSVNRQINELPGNPYGGLGLDTPVGTNPVAAVSEYFDEDSILDVAVVNQISNTISILKGTGNGNFTLKASLSTGNIPFGIAVGDLNDDGHPDLVVAQKGSNTVGVFLGSGDGTFQARSDFATASMPSDVIIEDLNRDGKFDLAVASYGSSKVSLLTGNGDGTFNTRVDYATGGGAQVVRAGDLNSDGILDLLTANNSDGTLSVLLGNSDGTFVGKVDYTVGALPSGLVLGFFNHDDVLDLAVANSGDGTLSILMGAGDGSFGTPDTPSIGTSPVWISAGDFSGSGKTDLVCSMGIQNEFDYLKGSGNGLFDNPVPHYENGAINAGLSVDLNGDGKLDFLILDGTNNRVSARIGQ